jgi:Asp/Glu/hydantoin racemase
MPTSPTPLVYIVHTSFVSVEYLTALFKELCPEATVRHIVDDSLLAEVLAHKGLTAGVRRRMLTYYQAADAAGADLIFNQCSSVGEAADSAARTLRAPVIKVDSAMAEEACLKGRRIGVIATLETTLGPTCRLIRTTARRLRRDIEIIPCLIAGAFEQLLKGDRPRHNKMVLAGIRKLVRTTDIVVCAQGSMVAILPQLGRTRVPVLTSPKLGVTQAVTLLRQRRAARPAGRRRAAS